MALNKSYQLRFNDLELEEVKKFAQENGTTVSAVIREALAKYIQEAE